MFRLVSHVEMESWLNVKIRYYNWNTAEWDTVIDDPMAPSQNRLIWASGAPDGLDPDDYRDTNGRFKVRIEWSNLPIDSTRIRIVEATWVLVPDA